METRNYVRESDYPTEESKKKFIRESFEIDENEILNQDEKLKEFLDKFSGLAANPKHYNLSYCCYAKTSSPAAQQHHNKVYGNLFPLLVFNSP